MEQKMGQATSAQISRVQMRHFDVESQISNMVRDLTLEQKEKLLTKMPGIIDKL